jgi:hypothetical protein
MLKLSKKSLYFICYTQSPAYLSCYIQPLVSLLLGIPVIDQINSIPQTTEPLDLVPLASPKHSYLNIMLDSDGTGHGKRLDRHIHPRFLADRPMFQYIKCDVHGPIRLTIPVSYLLGGSKGSSRINSLINTHNLERSDVQVSAHVVTVAVEP